MSEQEQNKETVRKAIEAFNKQDLNLFWSYHTEDTTSWEVYFSEPLTKAQMTEQDPTNAMSSWLALEIERLSGAWRAVVLTSR